VLLFQFMFAKTEKNAERGKKVGSFEKRAQNVNLDALVRVDTAPGMKIKKKEGDWWTTVGKGV